MTMTNRTPLHILLVEDNDDDALLLKYELQRGGYDVTFERVQNGQDFTSALVRQKWDVILSDYSLPTFNAPAALKVVQELNLDIPFIIVSGTVGEDTAVAAMKAGAHDFFAKDKLKLLMPAIEREMREAEDRRKRRWTEQQLHKSEERFSKAFLASPVGISIITMEGRFLDVNEQFLALTSYTIDEITGKTLLELASWGDPQTLMHIVREQIASRNLEMICLTRIGETRELLISSEAIDVDGEACTLLLLHDITARKQAQNELRALHNAVSYLFNADSLLSLGNQIVQAVVKEIGQVDCGLLLVDRTQNQMTRLARAGKQHVETEAPLYLDGPGLVPEAVRTEKFIYAPNVRRHANYVANNPSTQSECVVPLKTVNGLHGVLDLQSVEFDAFTERDQRILLAFAERAAAAIESMQLYEAISHHASELESRVAERTSELQRVKEHIEAILDNSSDSILVISPDGAIEQINQAFSHLFGYDGTETYGQMLANFTATDQKEMLTNAIRAVANDKQPLRLDCIVYRRDGTAINAEMALSAVTEQENRKTNVICNLRDVTERKKIEQELREALEKEKELNQLKSRFVSMVSHEFRTPLSTIQSSAELVHLYSNRMTDERKREHLLRIENQVKHLTLLLDEILSYNKDPTVGLEFNPSLIELEPFCLGLVSAIQMNAPERQVDAQLDIDACPFVLIDPKLMGQILTNLLSNAIKYSPNGDTVEFVVTCDRNQVTFRVTDHGIGIPEDDRKRLFEAFHRASNVGGIPGTGLGLAIVKQAVDAHQGSIMVESEVGKGTSLTVMIPLFENHPQTR
jgi:PAS domain S-box-containing protein